MTRFGIVSPALKFRFDADGNTLPAPCTVTYPPADGDVAVTFNTTADTPLAGTPPRPSTVTDTVPCPAPAASAPPTPERVSITRAGANGPNAPAALGVPEM